jgi:hypothetical protein
MLVLFFWTLYFAKEVITYMIIFLNGNDLWENLAKSVSNVQNLNKVNESNGFNFSFWEKIANKKKEAASYWQ